MAGSCDWVTLDGGLKAWYGKPEGDGPFPCVLIYIEAFGVNDHFKRLAQRFADAGYVSITPDIYDGKTYSYDDMPGAIGHLKQMDDDKVMAQSRQCLDHLAAQSEADADRVAVTGFCMGGRYTFLANAVLTGRIKAASAFYGGGIGPVQDVAGRAVLLDRVPEMQTPIQLWYGSEDQSIGPDELGRIAKCMAEEKKFFQMTVFPGVGHGFFCEDRGSYDATAAEKGWAGTLAFFADYL